MRGVWRKSEDSVKNRKAETFRLNQKKFNVGIWWVRDEEEGQREQKRRQQVERGKSKGREEEKLKSLKT